MATKRAVAIRPPMREARAGAAGASALLRGGIHEATVDRLAHVDLGRSGCRP